MVNIKKTTTTTSSLKLTGNDILDYVRRGSAVNIPASAKISVQVPSGGDWSGTDLDLHSDTTVDILWETVEEG